MTRQRLTRLRAAAAAVALSTALTGAAVAVASPAQARVTCPSTYGTILIGAGYYGATVQIHNTLSSHSVSGTTLYCRFRGDRYDYGIDGSMRPIASDWSTASSGASAQGSMRARG